MLQKIPVFLETMINVAENTEERSLSSLFIEIAVDCIIIFYYHRSQVEFRHALK
jgi:hypothetical protein